jgi:hypothetical protein
MLDANAVLGDRRRGLRRSIAATVAVVMALALLPSIGADAAPRGPGGPPTSPPAGSPPGGPADPPGLTDGFGIEVLSSAPDQVTGGDARIAIAVPRQVPPHQVRVLLNGEDVTEAFTIGGRRLEGVLSGMHLGENDLVVRANGQGRARPVGRLTLVNHPASGPVFSGPQQQPFVCTTARYGLGQPLVDNQDGIGIPVAAEDADGDYPRDGRGYPTADADIVGWSKDCTAETDVRWLARTTAGAWVPWSPGEPAPADIATADVLDGPSDVPFLVRQERGTSNRFIYSITTLVDPAAPDVPVWNDRLVFNLEGGVAIGRTQGNVSQGAQLRVDTLQRGYAVVHSTGLRMNTHYNLQLGGETALMLKERFIVANGVPRYTISVGGSGGAIQQYVYAQNHPGVFDALVPQISYPDMVTQTLHVGDCELLEYYMDVLDQDNPKWRQPAFRRALQGLNVVEEPRNWSAGTIAAFNGLAQAYLAFGIPLIDRAETSPLLSGQGECRKGWQGLTPLVLNPTFTNVADIDKLAQDISDVEWTHWADLVNIYGTDETGFARVPWDNVGVPYGLRAFVDGMIDTEEFVKLNALIGGWKSTSAMVPEGFPFTTTSPTPANFDPWSRRNATEPIGDVRPRTQGDLLAIERAHTSGMVFQGDIDVPIIDWRPYLEEELDMHNSHQSFAARQRILDAKGEADNHVIWFTDARPSAQFDQTMQAFAVLDEWLLNLEANPDLSVAAAKPAAAVDSCFRTDGSLWYAGDDVWNGILDDGPAGPCTEAFPTFTTSRIEAGAPINGDVFKCVTKPLADALGDGTFGDRASEFTEAQLERLDRAFPEGVCDRSRPPIRGVGG